MSWRRRRRKAGGMPPPAPAKSWAEILWDALCDFVEDLVT